MKNPIIDHSWNKIVETDARGLAFTEQKLLEVKELTRQLGQLEGQEVARNVMHSGLIESALQRCKEFHEGVGHLSIDDLHINYRYATQAMEESQRIIDKELSHLGL